MKQPNDIDRLVAKNLSHFRTDRGISLADIARNGGLSYQQIQKYESGSNRITAGRLWWFSQFYGVPIQYFFEEEI